MESDAHGHDNYFRIETNSNDWKPEALKAPRLFADTGPEHDGGAAADSGAAC
jgi:hypothetical protein